MLDINDLYEKLSESEAKRLHSLLRERHGNTKACSELTNLTPVTLRRAAGRMDITKDSAKVIREKLLSNRLVAA